MNEPHNSAPIVSNSSEQVCGEHLPDSLRKELHDGIAAFQSVVSNGLNHYKVEIDCSLLPEPTWIKGDKAPEAISILYANALPEKLHPCLYYYEILENVGNRKILDAYETFRRSNGGMRATAALKKYPPLHTRILYVGKSKGDVRGRVYAHLGYYHVGATAGLQLVCWAKQIGLRLRLHVYEFPREMQSYVSCLELGFARSLQPLIGKH